MSVRIRHLKLWLKFIKFAFIKWATYAVYLNRRTVIKEQQKDNLHNEVKHVDPCRIGFNKIYPDQNRWTC